MKWHKITLYDRLNVILTKHNGLNIVTYCKFLQLWIKHWMTSSLIIWFCDMSKYSCKKIPIYHEGIVWCILLCFVARQSPTDERVNDRRQQSAKKHIKIKQISIDNVMQATAGSKLQDLHHTLSFTKSIHLSIYFRSV